MRSFSSSKKLSYSGGVWNSESVIFRLSVRLQQHIAGMQAPLVENSGLMRVTTSVISVSVFPWFVICTATFLFAPGPGGLLTGRL